MSAGKVSPLSVSPFKDVVLSEDAAPLSNYNSATNWSIIRNIAINLARLGGYDSLTKAEQILAHDIDKLFLLLEGIIPGLDCQDISFLAMPMGTDDPFVLSSLESHLDATIPGEGMS